jgi:hypothetical protein
MGWMVNDVACPLYALDVGRCPFYRRLVGPQGRSGQEQKISPLPGFVPCTRQSIASRYTDYAVLAHHVKGKKKFNKGKSPFW